MHRMFHEIMPGKETIDQVLGMYPLHSFNQSINQLHFTLVKKKLTI